jgi:signal peptidase I
VEKDLVIAISLSALAILLSIIFARRLLVIATIKQNSMSPAFNPGDRVLALRVWKFRKLHKDQIVLVQPSSCHLHNTLYIKRVVGLPGDEIRVCITDDGINNTLDIPQGYQGEDYRRVWYLPKESLLSFKQRGGISSLTLLNYNQYKFQIPAGYIFVRGDQADSIDSRVWGPIPKSNLAGVVILRLPLKTACAEKTVFRYLKG